MASRAVNTGLTMPVILKVMPAISRLPLPLHVKPGVLIPMTVGPRNKIPKATAVSRILRTSIINKAPTINSRMDMMPTTLSINRISSIRSIKGIRIPMHHLMTLTHHMTRMLQKVNEV